MYSKIPGFGGWAARAKYPSTSASLRLPTHLDEALKKGELREDLYYRLNVFQIQLPPLRQRMSDLPVLTEALIKQLNRKHQVNVTELHPDVTEAFKKYPWPGNVRELRNVLERAVIVAGEGTIQTAHLPYDFGVSMGARNPAQVFEPETVRLPVGTTVAQAEKGSNSAHSSTHQKQQNARGRHSRHQFENAVQQTEGIRL